MAIIQSGESARGGPRALLVEGSTSIHRHLGRRLQDQGVALTTVDSVCSALETLQTRSFRVIIIDLVLPDGSGLEVLDAVRASGSTAHVIMMGSSNPRDRSAAADRGAAVYVVKPCLLRELASQVVAVGQWAEPEADALLAVGKFTVDLRARQVRGPDQILELTGKEFDLLAFLAARPGHVFGRDELLRSVWHSSPEWQQVATVTEHIRRLRMKIEIDPRAPQILRTVRGSGYRLDLPPTEGDAEAEFERGTIIQIAGRIVHADSAARVLIGPTPGTELVGRRLSEVVASTSCPATGERMHLAELNPTRRTQLIDLERADGTEISVEVASEQISWGAQPAERVTLTHAPDLSARLRRLVTGVLGEVADAVIITDLHFHLRSWNRAAERLYGWSEHEILGRHVLDVLKPRGDSASDEALAATWADLESSGRWKGEGQHLTRDSSAIDVLSSTTLVRDHAGEPILIVTISRPTRASASENEIATTQDEDAQIRKGLDNDAFVVHYQPIIDLAGDQVVGMEALVRWNHPERGLLGPDSFIGAAERSGAIIELGTVVFEKACRQAAEWRRTGKDLTLSVNLSARQLADPMLFEQITTVLAFTGLDPDHLWLEVTETALIEDVDRASTTLHRLADLGIGVTIDDFGTGWASLTYLRSFPIHAIKIDRSFVAGLGANANDTAIVRSILALGAELGLYVVAEGIETRSQQLALQQMGCTIGQGFLYGRPGPALDNPTNQSGGLVHALTSELPPPPAPRGVDRPPVRPALAPITRLSTAELFLGQEGVPGETPSSRGHQGRTALRRLPVTTDRSTNDAESSIVADLLRKLLQIRSAPGAANVLQRTIRKLGGLPVLATDSRGHALLIDVSLGLGPPMVVNVERSSAAHEQLERLLPRLVDDARNAVDLLRQAERTTT